MPALRAAPTPDRRRDRQGGRRGSFWPSEQQRLLLRAALLPDERSEEAWRAVRPELDIERLEKGSSMLLPLVSETLTAHGIDDPALSKMKGVYRYVWAGNQIQLGALRDVVQTLGGAEVEAILMGSASLATGAYESGGARRVVEPAVLVRPTDVARALDALGADRWIVGPLSSDRHRPVERPGEPSCTLHWRLTPELDQALQGQLSAESFREAAVAAELLGVATRRLAWTDELLLACVNGAKSGVASRVQWITDSATIVQHRGAELDWDRLVSEAVTRRCQLRVLDALGYLAAELDVDVPAPVLERLASEPSSSRERLAHRLSGHGALLGNALPLLGAHLVATQDRHLATSLVTFPRALSASWGLAHVAQLPMGAARRGRAAISAERSFRAHRR